MKIIIISQVEEIGKISQNVDSHSTTEALRLRKTNQLGGVSV